MAEEPRTAGERWPNFFLIGAPRCGTTSLHVALGRHPDIFMSRPKEPFYFALEPGATNSVGISDRDAYVDLFRSAGDERVVGESSAFYLASLQAPARVAAVSPDAHIVAILRDPIERADSYHRLLSSHGAERRPILDALREDVARGGPPPDGPRVFADIAALLPEADSIYIEPSRYCAGLKRWLDLFGDRVLILFYEDLAADPARALRRIYEHVGVDATDPALLELPAANVHHKPRGPLARVAYSAAKRLVPARHLLGPRSQRLFFRRVPKPAPDAEVVAFLREQLAGERECLRELLGYEPPWPER
ncbi:MAG: hypothetical protein QOE36_1404 [Gaiellaceae bacterium]|jgi:hypothetical protein|nr:hypothetical protein [Gaiellaceae bacterium]